MGTRMVVLRFLLLLVAFPFSLLWGQDYSLLTYHDEWFKYTHLAQPLLPLEMNQIGIKRIEQRIYEFVNDKKGRLEAVIIQEYDQKGRLIVQEEQRLFDRQKKVANVLKTAQVSKPQRVLQKFNYGNGIIEGERWHERSNAAAHTKEYFRVEISSEKDSLSVYRFKDYRLYQEEKLKPPPFRNSINWSTPSSSEMNRGVRLFGDFRDTLLNLSEFLPRMEDTQMIVCKKEFTYGEERFTVLLYYTRSRMAKDFLGLEFVSLRQYNEETRETMLKLSKYRADLHRTSFGGVRSTLLDGKEISRSLVARALDSKFEYLDFDEQGRWTKRIGVNKTPWAWGNHHAQLTERITIYKK